MAKRIAGIWCAALLLLVLMLWMAPTIALAAGASGEPEGADDGLPSADLIAAQAVAEDDGGAISTGALRAQSVTVTIDNGLYYIPDSSGQGWLLYGCQGKPTSVSIPLLVKEKRVTGIAPGAFKGKTSLSMVTLADNAIGNASFKTVGASAFENCTNLAMVYLPNAVESIGDNAFRGCSKLTYMNQLGHEFTEYANTICDYTFRDDVSKLKTIGVSAFEGCNFETVYLPASVTTVSANAFKDCAKLDRVASKPSGITSFGESAFQGCTALRGITMPQTITQISPHLFDGCTKLSDVYLSENTTKIGDYAFYGCTNLLEFGFSGYGDLYRSSTKWTGSAGLEHYQLSTYVEGIENVTTIGNSAFRGCTKLQKFNFCDGLKAIGTYAFADCPALESAELPDGLTSLGESAFNRDTGLATFSFPRGTSFTTIPQSVLSGCTGMQFLTISANISHIGLNAFKGMTGLTAAYFQGTSFTTDNSSNETPFTGCSNTGLTLYGHTGAGDFKNFAQKCKTCGHIAGFEDLVEAGQVTIIFNGWLSDKRTVTGPPSSVVTVPNYSYDDGVRYFVEWNRNSPNPDNKTAYAPGDSIRLGMADEVLTAVFEKVDTASETVTVTVTDPKAGASGSTKTHTRVSGSSFVLPECTTKGTSADGKTGYAFSGWQVGSDATKRQPGETITVTEDTTITAQFATTYKVIFKVTQGDAFFLDEEENHVKQLELYTDLDGTVSIPTAYRPNFKVTRWSTTGQYGSTIKVDESTSFSQVMQNNGYNTPTVQPTWVSASQPVLTFDPAPGTVDGSTDPVNVETNSSYKVSADEVPTASRPGYKFNGWAKVNSDGETEIIYSFGPRTFWEDTTLYADWSPILVSSLALDKASASLLEGKTLQLKATVSPSAVADGSITWATGDAKVAAVNSDGLVTAVGAGSTTITATAADGGGAKAVCTISVTALATTPSNQEKPTTTPVKTTPISEATVSMPSAMTYTGKNLTPAPTVKLGSTTLKADTDYALSYAANKSVGEASVVITGKGAYTGEKRATFVINPKGTKLAKLSAAKKSVKVKWKKQAKQTTGYQLRYSLKKSMKSAKIVTVKGAKKTSGKIGKLKPKKTYYVQVRTYKKVGTKMYCSAWSQAKKAKVK